MLDELIAYIHIDVEALCRLSWLKSSSIFSNIFLTIKNIYCLRLVWSELIYLLYLKQIICTPPFNSTFSKFQDSMSELRELCYPGTDVLMLCFSVVRPETFRSVAERWTKAVANVNAPLILVGTQSDLAQDSRVLQTLKV